MLDTSLFSGFKFEWVAAWSSHNIFILNKIKVNHLTLKLLKSTLPTILRSLLESQVSPTQPI